MRYRALEHIEEGPYIVASVIRWNELETCAISENELDALLAEEPSSYEKELADDLEEREKELEKALKKITVLEELADDAYDLLAKNPRAKEWRDRATKMVGTPGECGICRPSHAVRGRCTRHGLRVRS